jgi:hypothetical protein
MVVMGFSSCYDQQNGRLALVRARGGGGSRSMIDWRDPVQGLIILRRARMIGRVWEAGTKEREAGTE